MKMMVIERRFDVNLISAQVLSQYMEHRGFSLKRLADAVCILGVPTSKATIGHLVSGHTKATLPARARAICKVLDVPVNVLFSPKVSIVKRASARTATTAASAQRRAS